MGESGRQLESITS